MSAILARIAVLAMLLGVSISTMMFGWGVTPKSWGWIIGMGFVGNVSVLMLNHWLEKEDKDESER